MEITHQRTAQLLDLPAELIIHILSNLDFVDALAVSSVNVFLRTCLITSRQLEFRFASQIAGVTDNLHRKLGLDDRVRMLRRLEDGWHGFQVDFRRTLPILHEPFGIYDLTGGIYLMGDLNQKVLHYCRLPSSADDSVVWSRIDMDPSLTIVDVGLSIYEHDLIAVVTTMPTDTNLLKVEVQLLEFSTGKPHPLVRNPVLFVRNTFRPTASSIGIEIAGEYLALVTTPGLSELTARFCVYEWKTGTIVLDYSVASGTYCSIIFLSPTHILLPNAQTGTLDLFVISPSNPNTPGPSLRLALPSLKPSYSIHAIYGRCEPNPSPTGFPYSPHPFHPTPEDAIAVFKLHVRNNNDAAHEWGDFSMFVHRSTLLRLCEERGRDRETTRTVNWEEWGPPVTRWVDAAVVPWWITTSTGQRCVLSVAPDALGEGLTPFIMLLDFNPFAVKRALAVRKYNGNKGSDVDGRCNVHVGSSLIQSSVFDACVESALPYVSIVRYLDVDVNFDGVLMDEERLLGLATDDGGNIRKIEVFHIGNDQSGLSS
ncbi:hypothetical protein C0989_005103 [Termitomyces sp. Mn162]|nr:hypothetical protein C0989_005103 [Termitomyces sp. Mn162]